MHYPIPRELPDVTRNACDKGADDKDGIVLVNQMRPRWAFMIMLHDNFVKLLLLYSRNGRYALPYSEAIVLLQRLRSKTSYAPNEFHGSFQLLITESSLLGLNGSMSGLGFSCDGIDGDGWYSAFQSGDGVCGDSGTAADGVVGYFLGRFSCACASFFAFWRA